jgi:hypothetical protein
VNNTVIISIGAVVVLAGVALYVVSKSKTNEAQAALQGYDAGLARGSKRSESEKLGGAIGTIATSIFG